MNNLGQAQIHNLTQLGLKTSMRVTPPCYGEVTRQLLKKISDIVRRCI